MKKSSNKNVIFFNKHVCFNCFAPRKAKKVSIFRRRFRGFH
jgi:hypothetical protein